MPVDFVNFALRPSVYNILVKVKQRRELRRWVRAHAGSPPHLVKQSVIKEYVRRFDTRILIESGTYRGDMVHALLDVFERIVSIELNPELHRWSTRRFAKYHHVEIRLGDSAAVLPSVLSSIYMPCLFWLDGHFSAGVTARGQVETPILMELSHICSHPVDGHVILIDDARCFTGVGDYPTIDEVRAFVAARQPAWTLQVKDDIIRITPRDKD